MTEGQVMVLSLKGMIVQECVSLKFNMRLSSSAFEMRGQKNEFKGFVTNAR